MTDTAPDDVRDPSPPATAGRGDRPPAFNEDPASASGMDWGAALLMAAAPFLLMALLILADRLLR